jgi:hypothetical protein
MQELLDVVIWQKFYETIKGRDWEGRDRGLLQAKIIKTC